MSEIDVNLEYLKALRKHAISSYTLEKWSEIAVEWMEAAQKEIDRLTQEKGEGK